MSNAEINARIGRTYYQAMTDAAGYPNGMAYWPDLTSQDKYHYTCTGLGFLEMLVSMGTITINQPVGLGESPKWGEGECKELMDYFDANRAKEKQEFEERVAHINARLNKNKAG